MKLALLNLARRSLPATLLASALAAVAVPAFALTEGKDAYGNHFVSGGVSNGELRELESRRNEHHLSLVTASEHGAYLAGVLVRITDSSGNVALETEMDGPWLLADLPPGKYSLEAVFEDQTKRQQVAIPAGGSQRVDLHFATGDRVSPDQQSRRIRAG
jgi:hypothetical protein